MSLRSISQKPGWPRLPAVIVLDRLTWLQWGLLFIVVLLTALFLGGAIGLVSGNHMKGRLRDQANAVSAQVQFDLALTDLEAGRYSLARQRLEYVIGLDPQFPGAFEKLTEAMMVLASPDRIVAQVVEVAPTPTIDPRPAGDLFDKAQSHFASGEWTQAIDTIVALRAVDPQYKVVAVDRIVYLSLRFRGEQRILNEGNLEGGLYDLALAERFAPLDPQTQTVREWARLYVIGASYWGVMPDEAIYYFQQLALAAPGIRDASGLTAAERYKLALVQFADLLAANGDWCAAQEKYQIAGEQGLDPGVAPTATHVAGMCSNPGQVQTPAPITVTPTITPGGPTITPTPTFGPLQSETAMPTQTETPPFTSTPTATEELLPEATPTPTVTETLEG